MWNGSPDFLGKARAILADRSANADQLGIALINIHSALEQHFRNSLAANNQVPPETHERLLHSREIDWPQLLELMSTYEGLGTIHAGTIRSMNKIRNAIAHRGGTYRGSHQELVRYADLAESLITGRERSFAGAAMSNELYEASMAALGMGTPAKEQAVGDLPPPVPAQSATAAPSRTQQRPAPAPTRPHNAAAPTHAAAPARGGPNNSRLVPSTIIVAIVLIIVLILLLRSFAGGGSSKPLSPTPTLGLSGSAIGIGTGTAAGRPEVVALAMV